MLGETPLPAQTRSIFDYMSQKDRERLESIRDNLTAGAPKTPPERAPSTPPPPLRPGELDIPHVHPSVAKAALQGFQPFIADPVKHSRYTAFLNHAADASGNTQLAIGPLPGQRMEDFNKELADYAKSATVFKPLSGAMASRFKSAAIIETGPKIVEGLHTPDVAAEEPEEQVEEKKEEDPRMAAVRLGMYGPLTREVTPWQPARLLCKRFGVKDPEVELGTQDSGTPERATGAGAPADAGAMAPPPLSITDGSAEGDAAQTERKGPRNLANVGLGEDEDQGRDTLTYQRPAMDIFKAIFASDDEDSDVGEDELAPPATATPAPSSAPPSHPPATEPTSVTHVPKTSTPPAAEANEKVDLATFKPTFVPRSDRESRKEKDREKDKEKKRDKKKKAATLVSFDTEEDGLQINVSAAKHKNKDKDGERKKKKKRREKKEDVEDDDSMWVEKPAPEVVQSMVVDNSVLGAPPPEAHPDAVVGPPRGRKRAIDFM